MKFNKIWGYGQLFGYSAFDGENRYKDDNIIMLMNEPLTFRFEYRPYFISMSFKGFKDISFEAVMSDFVIANTDNEKFLLTFIDNDTLIIKSKVLPSFIGEEPLKEYKQNDIDVIETKNHYLMIKSKKVNDSYLIIVHHSFNKDSMKYNIDDYNIDNIIKDKISFYDKMPKCLDKKYETLYYKSWSVIKVNTHSKEGQIDDFWTTPDRLPHRHMWMWDSAFHAMTIVEFDQEAAKKCFLVMLKQIRKDGMMPHMVTTTDCSNVTQPCIMSWAAWYVYQKTKDINFLKQCLPYLETYLTYDIKNRDKNNNGLLEWWTDPNNLKCCKCAECGLDNSPRFDFDEEMDAIDFSSYLALDADYLSKIYLELNNKEKANEWKKVRDNVSKNINELMWDEDTGAYYDRLFSGKLTKVLTPTSFLPMFASVANRHQAEKLIKTLTDKELLWTPNPVSTISQKDKRFSNDMWRGGVWLNLNYFIIKGLSNYGYIDLADKLRDITLDFVNKWYLKSGCIFEFFDPLNETMPYLCHRKGEPLPVPDYRKKMHTITDFNWSACFSILLIQKKY